ncbi:hypothetical protein ALO46_200078 [Pseudomonas syringae pv. solidagae]|uniref:Uncharacterized protein n=2 Tax=Pseudomonas TaxID=286 RepID=A0A1I0FA12_9PSED|nr:hypothetical protein ALO46_200078 [Pseudomonas syringae pv. solidagae]RMN70958.1 hypothetical protein ALQ54_200151 [Pseudomonas syringae]RMR20378.1 hypothetical protein ALP90_200180 [Pseudomonas amygdali pv. ulmi]RMU40875.1 hypothetical protein ALP30_200129 [Pseudomonas syringae pv. primulae]SET54772.1 hypothetical protein SAMN05216197_11643 [Pseudomonas graminis]
MRIVTDSRPNEILRLALREYVQGVPYLGPIFR